MRVPISDPLVSVGMPTYNGERFLREALDALRAQDYPNLRLLISDNASTDGTQGICEAAAAADDRITYRRNPENVGAARNFNDTFTLTEGDYFMWAADDDRWEPTYVSRCVAALEANPSAVMATTALQFIDESGAVIARNYWRYDNPDMSSESVAERVAILVRRAGWYQSYGLARRTALARTRLFGDVYGPDVVLMMELALQGPIVKVPEVLFFYRQVSGKTEEARVKRQERIADEGRILQAKYTYLQEGLTGAIRRSPLPWLTKIGLIRDVLKASYLDRTPLSDHAIAELPVRRQSARREKDLRSIVKFEAIRVIRGVRRRWRRWRRRRARTPDRERTA